MEANNPATPARYEGTETTELGNSVEALLARTAARKADKKARSEAVRAEIEAARSGE